MIRDVWTIMWKEWKELFAQRGSTPGGLLRLLIMILVLGIVPPLEAGTQWLESVIAVGLSLWMPLFLVTSVVSDSFAGERERHTLETLLSSRLSDRAILLGKMATAVSYGWGLALLSMLIGAVTVNVAHGQGRLLFYTPPITLVILVGSFLTAWLAAGVGVWVSLRAPTVRQAQQTLSIAIMLLLFVPGFGIQLLPAEWRAQVSMALATMDLTRIFLIVLAVLAALDVAFLVAASARFRRARLILD